MPAGCFARWIDRCVTATRWSLAFATAPSLSARTGELKVSPNRCRKSDTKASVGEIWLSIRWMLSQARSGSQTLMAKGRPYIQYVTRHMMPTLSTMRMSSAKWHAINGFWLLPREYVNAPLTSGTRSLPDRSSPFHPSPSSEPLSATWITWTNASSRYVSAKRKLIALLEEEKQAIVNGAVTRGLDPNVRLKPSGVEWLGDVPEHWQVIKLRRCVSISGGMTPSMDVHRFWNGPVPWVTPKDMKQAVISDSSVKTTEVAVHETSLQLIEPPAILMVVRGMILARRVPIASTTTPVTINQDMKALKALRGINAAYLARSLDSAQVAFVPLIDEAGHGTRRLPMHRWRELPVAIPPLSEQATIVQHIDDATADLDSVVARARRQIELLQEYRTRLIADVVTGKLDVRHVAAQLPDEADDQGPIGESPPLVDGLPGDLYDIDESVEDSVVEQEVTA